MQTQGEVNGNYYTPEVIYNSGSNRMKLRYPNTWTVTLEDNGSNLPLNNIGSGNVQTGYQGYMTTNSPPSGFPANFC